MVYSTRPMVFCCRGKADFQPARVCLQMEHTWGCPCPTECEGGVVAGGPFPSPSQRNEPGERCLWKFSSTGGAPALLINPSAALCSFLPSLCLSSEPPAAAETFLPSQRQKDPPAFPAATYHGPRLSVASLPAAARAMLSVPDPAGAAACPGWWEAWRGHRVHPRPAEPSQRWPPACGAPGAVGLGGCLDGLSWKARTTKPRYVFPLNRPALSCGSLPYPGAQGKGGAGWRGQVKRFHELGAPNVTSCLVWDSWDQDGD